MQYSLPRASQEKYTKWFKKSIERGSLNGYIILWVGNELSCRFRSETIKNEIDPSHVFIVKKEGDFEYALVDNTDMFYKLPKKFYTSCFPGVQYSSIPKTNRMKIKITKNVTVELPFIPESFLDQKRNKCGRKRRKVFTGESTCPSAENIDFNTTFPSWHIVENSQNKHHPKKRELLFLIRSIIYYGDKNEHFNLPDPFADVDLTFSSEKGLSDLKTIISFIYHYCRAEMGCFHDYTMSKHDITPLIEALCSKDLN
jgi:hypothetical protein